MLNKKDEKIFIDLDDEITFVVERIKDTDADRITLVAPEGAGVISSLISLKLLSKLVYKLGKSLVLVTMDEAGQKFGKKAGIPVVKRVAEVSEELWLAPEAKLKKRGLYPILGKKPVKTEEIEEKAEKASEEKVEDIVEQEVEEEKVVEDVEGGKEISKETGEVVDATTLVRGTKNGVVAEKIPSLEDFGFAVDKDVAKQPAFLERSKPTTPVVFEEEKTDLLPIEEKQEFVSDFKPGQVGTKGASSAGKDDLKIVGKDMTGYKLEEPTIRKFNPIVLFSSLKKIKLPKIGAKTALPVAGFLAVLGAVGGVYAYFIAPTATVELSVKFDTIDLQQEIRAVQLVSDVDLENLKIPLILQEVEESGSDSAQATKAETRGEKAKGKVTLVNKTESTLQLEEGTALTGAGYDFVLTSNVEVDAADIFAGTLGRKDVDVEAYDIGEEYNLDSGVEFSVEGYTTGALVGKNFDAFSGGSKEEVLVVSAEDRDGLKTSLEDRLKERARNKVQDQVGEGFVFNDDMIDLEISNETFDAEIGDERDSFNLDMTVKAKAYIYATEDLKTLGKQLLQGEVTSGLKLLEEESEFVGDFLRRDGEDAVLDLKVTGVIAGDVTEESVKDLIAGKKSEEADALLSSLEGVTGYSITYGPEWLPDSLQHVPTIKGKIFVDMKLDKEKVATEAEE